MRRNPQVRPMLLRAGSVILALTIVLAPGGYLTLLSTALAQAAGFLESFDGNPPAPVTFTSLHWDASVHTIDANQFIPMQAQHGADCGSPPATHAISTYDQAVFMCNG